jgi:hypothetical protein
MKGWPRCALWLAGRPLRSRAGVYITDGALCNLTVTAGAATGGRSAAYKADAAGPVSTAAKDIAEGAGHGTHTCHRQRSAADQMPMT